MGIIQAFAKNFVDGFKVGFAQSQFKEVIGMDRDSACQFIFQFVEQSTRERLDAFEQAFLNQSIALKSTDYRLRAMELYAYLKFREMVQFGEFGGFLGTPERL
jgi:hypothetical protein